MAISAYNAFFSPKFIEHLVAQSETVPGLDSLRVATGLQAEFPDIETPDALHFVATLFQQIEGRLEALLNARARDRAFCDAQTLSCMQQNAGVDFHSAEYQTVIGARDDSGRLVVGPLPNPPNTPAKHAPFLDGEQVTIFGPPDTEKMSINAMNCLHHQLPGEDPLIAELVQSGGQVPRWGADNEDSKTPIMRNLLRACRNLVGCFDQTISFDDARKGKQYRLKDSQLAIPIKRIPGLALPDGNHLYEGNPLPLHLVDFAFHLFHNWAHPEALIFYVPKLENEEEAAYVQHMITCAERLIQAQHPSYELGTVGLFIVFENPRAIFRIREIASALSPHFVGGSLGWHDFLASTARLFKHDPNYRIPVKADPNIVINHIKESHLILQKNLAPIGGIALGGMYGTLYEDGNPESFELSMVGYIKDVITQMKRGLNGFWVAHPNFVRIGIALVEAWRRYEQDTRDDSLQRLVAVLVPNPVEQAPLLEFVFGPDVDGLDETHPLYARGVLAADIEVSDVIANHDELEVRYNVFQALQYLADWLCGNGCVALPAQLTNRNGEPVFVRIMDDLATTERSRWELWAEVNHGRVSVETFERILAEEVAFIQADQDSDIKRVQVRWRGEAARWYPIAVELLRQLVRDPNPVEFVSELLIPYTFDFVRDSANPQAVVEALIGDA